MLASDPLADMPVVRACDLSKSDEGARWLIEPLWLAQGVGLVGGAPKSCKSWLGLEMATSLATQTPCLGAYEPKTSGPVLIYMAEDAQHMVRQRLEALCRHRSLPLSALNVYVITADQLRLDTPDDQRRLEACVDRLRPVMVLLDPLVRMHRIDENRADEVSVLLAFLRCLQRRYETAVVLVHHTRKNGSASQPGQALRGSGDLHAFGDSNLYLRRARDRLVLTFEHRAAKAPDPVELALNGSDTPYLEVVGRHQPPADDLAPAVLTTLAEAAGPLTRTQLRERVGVRNARLGDVLASLEQQGKLSRSPAGWTPALPSVRSHSPT